MSAVPAEIAGIGSTQQKLRVSPGFDALNAPIKPEEYFVLSRIDGSQTLRQILLSTGLSLEHSIAIVQRLRELGAVLLPGETTAPPAAPRARGSSVPPRTSTAPRGTPVVKPVRAAGTSSTPSVDNKRGHDLTLPNTTADELVALGEKHELDEKVRRKILAIERLVDGQDLHALLGVSASATARELKRAYFLLSKEIHPDRYYGKELGSFGARMSRTFEAVSRAYGQLTNTAKKNKAASSAASHSMRAQSEEPQTPQSYASELFDRACQLEVQGDALQAMKLFAAAVRVDAQLRYLRRAASCALAANQPRSAVEYAKKANGMSPNDPSSARLLADAFRAAGKLTDAEEVLVMAMAMKSENDTLMAELRNDLEKVRRLLAQS